MATQTKIDIRSASGETLLQTAINEGAKGYYSLMQHDYIVLPFKLRTPIDFKIGSYVDLRGVFDDALGGKLAKMYYVTENQNPTYNTSTSAYEYQLRLNAYYWLWNNFIFKYTPENTAGEASWSLTAPLDVQLGVFLRNLSELGFTYNGVPYEYSIDPTVGNKAVAMTYDNMHLLDALFSMGGENAWDCDVWVTENVIHFGRCEHGDAVKIETGVEASDMTRNESKGTFATRIYAFGSDRNIPENYRPNTNEDLTVNGIVQKRLMMPEDTPYIDAYPDMHPFEVVEAIVVFDEVYPKRIGTLSDVQPVDRAIEGEGGEQTGTFKAYQYKDTGLTFDKKYILEGKELRIVFQSGKLNGLDFGVTFNPNGSNPAEQLWEIVANEDYGRRLPDEVMKPEDGDKYILYGFDIKMVSDLYIPEAQQELKERAQEYVDKTKVDDGTYTVTLRWSWVKEDMIRRTFDVGQKINLVNPGFFGEEGRISRVIGWEMCLDIPYDNPVYTIGESAQYSRLNEIEDKVDSIVYNGQTYQGTGGGGSGVYVIKTNDSTPASDSNVFSALRSLSTFLRKDKEDSTQYLLRLLGGIEVGEAIDSFLAGKGIIADTNGRIQADRIEVRGSMSVMELIINEITAMAGDYSFTDAGHIERVETVEDGTYKLFIRKDTEHDITSLGTDDVVYSIVNSLLTGGTDYYTSWMRVVAKNVNDNALTVVLYPDGEVPGGKNYPPAAGYNLTRRGNAVVPAEGEPQNQRAQSWLISSREGRMMFLANVYKPILEDYNYALTVGKLPNLAALGRLPVSTDDVGIVAQTIIAENFYQFDYNGDVVPKRVSRGEWSLATAQGDSPYRFVTHTSAQPDGSTVTLLEQHTVTHYGCLWGCLTDKTTEEPQWNAAGWVMLEGDPNYYLYFNLPTDYVCRVGQVSVRLEAWVKHGNRDITDVLMATAGTEVEWLRDSGDAPTDNAWSPQYVEGKKNVILIDNSDAHGVGSGFGYAYRQLAFVCRVFVPVGGDLQLLAENTFSIN